MFLSPLSRLRTERGHALFSCVKSGLFFLPFHAGFDAVFERTIFFLPEGFSEGGDNHSFFFAGTGTLLLDVTIFGPARTPSFLLKLRPLRRRFLYSATHKDLFFPPPPAKVAFFSPFGRECPPLVPRQTVQISPSDPKVPCSFLY